MYRRKLELTLEQRAELERVRDRRAYLRECAAALLKIADGQSTHQVAQTGLHKPWEPDTVYLWLNKYQQQGLAGLVYQPRGHRGFSPSASSRPGGSTPASSGDLWD
jgi:hypothetical protein